jgi:preprotein translocase subunit SecD
VQFTSRGAKRLRGFTGKPGRLLAITLDGELIGLHAVARAVKKPAKGDEEELSQLDVAGGFGTEEEAGYLALVFNSGPLPCALRVLSNQIVAD